MPSPAAFSYPITSRPTMLLRSIGMVLLLSLASTPTPVAAQTAAAADEEARFLFQAGQTAFDEGEFERALDYFERSYALSRRSELLFNIGATAERLRHDVRALEAFRQYIAELPSSANRRQVEARIALLERNLANASATPSATPASTPAPPPPPSSAEATAPTVDASESGSSIWYFVGAGVGAVVTGVGAAYWANRGSELERCRDANASGLECGNEADLQRQRNAGIALTAIGAVALPTTLVIGIVRGRSREATVAAGVAPSRSGLALRLTVRF